MLSTAHTSGPKKAERLGFLILLKKSWVQREHRAGIIDSKDMSLSKLQEIAKDRKAWCATVHGVTKSWTQLMTDQQQQRYVKTEMGEINSKSDLFKSQFNVITYSVGIFSNGFNLFDSIYIDLGLLFLS